MDQDAQRVIFGVCSGARAPTESPYKEVLSGRVESGLSAPPPLLDGADSFASSQHLQALSGTNLPPPLPPGLPEATCGIRV